MREILFRAKAINREEGREYRTHYKNGDWVYGLVTSLYDDRFPNCPAEMTNESGISGIDVDYQTIGQYTGLKDKNGIRIFEGDIVRKRIGKGKKDLPVIFEAGCFCCSSIRYTLDDCRIEIVGDIYDDKYKELHKYLLEHY